MYTDEDLRVSDAQAVTATAVSDSSVDLREARELGEGEKVRAYFTVNTTPTAAGAADVNFEIISATNAALTAGVKVIGRSGAIAIADLPAGREPIVVEINPDLQTIGQQFLGVRYTVGTGPLTAGAFTADFVADIQGTFKKSYPSGFTVTG